MITSLKKHPSRKQMSLGLSEEAVRLATHRTLTDRSDNTTGRRLIARKVSRKIPMPLINQIELPPTPRGPSKKELERQQQAVWFDQAMVEARRMGDFNMSNVSVDLITDELYSVHHLYGLRLCRMGMTEVPSRIGAELLVLREISFRSNELTRLPENLSNLMYLESLSAMHNKLEAIPDTFGRLTSLTKLDLSYNHLEYMPSTMDGMVSLTYCTLQHNRLSDMPEAMARLPRLTYLNLASNEFATVPESVIQCKPLQKLVMNTNQLIHLPDSLVTMPNLQEFHIANNLVEELPAQVGELAALQSLKLDWNRLEELPPSFAQLNSLREFTAEGCPMRVPGPDVIIMGPNAVRRWCETSTDSTVFRARQRTIRGLQLVCAQAVKYKLVDPAYLVHDIVRPNEDGRPLKYYGIVPDAIHKIIIPSVNAWREHTRGHSMSNYYAELQDIRDSLKTYFDHYGGAGEVDERVFFRRCVCKDKKGRPRPCVPPRVGFLCSRNGFFLRMRMETATSMQKIRSHEKEAELVITRTRKVHGEALDFLDSKAGKKWLKDAGKLAVEVCQHAVAVALDRYYRLRKRLRGALKFERKRMALVCSKGARTAKLMRKRAKLKAKADALPDDLPEQKFEIMGKRRDVGFIITHGATVNSKIDNIVDKFAAWAKKQAVEEEEFELEEEEAFAPINLPNPILNKISKQKSHHPREYCKAVAAEVDAIVEYIRLVRSGYRTRTEFAAMFKQQILTRKVRHEEHGVHENFGIIRRVGDRWALMGLKILFDAWLHWAKMRRQQRERMAEEDRQKAILLEEEKWAAKRLEEAERAKWVQKVDPFTDKKYFEHSETGEVAWKIPEGREFKARIKVLAGGKVSMIGAAAKAVEGRVDDKYDADGNLIVDMSTAMNSKLAQLRKLRQLRGSDSDSDDEEEVKAVAGDADLRLEDGDAEAAARPRTAATRATSATGRTGRTGRTAATAHTGASGFSGVLPGSVHELT